MFYCNVVYLILINLKMSSMTLNIIGARSRKINGSVKRDVNKLRTTFFDHLRLHLLL